jgi:choline kinase
VKAVILAAGSSTRLYPLTLEKPKCLLDVGGKTLLQHQLDALTECEVSEIVLVIGYLSDLILEAVEQITPSYIVPISAIHNPHYADTNNLYSLWVAREKLIGKPFVCLHADVLFHPGILQKCLESPAEICLVVDRQIREETMKVAISSGRITNVGKAIRPEDVSGTFLGIAKCSAEAGCAVLGEADALVELGQTNVYFTAAIERLIEKGYEVGFSLTDGLPWTEIDFLEDLERARTEIYPILKGTRMNTDEH